MRELDTTVNTRVRLKEREAIRAVAKARNMTTGELVREAVDQWVIKAGAPLTPEVRQQVVEKVTPRLDAQIQKETADAKSALDAALAGIPESLVLLTDRLKIVEDHLANSK